MTGNRDSAAFLLPVLVLEIPVPEILFLIDPERDHGRSLFFFLFPFLFVRIFVFPLFFFVDSHRLHIVTLIDVGV
ncbi:MAG: hypothetical protein AB1295_06500 [Candidatus Micrarchaeota archaeon]